MVASRQLLLLKNKTANTQGKNGLVVYADVRIGLALYGSSCSTRYDELHLFFGGKQKSVFKKMAADKKSFAKTAYKGATRGN
jgi:hypothetical protein